MSNERRGSKHKENVHSPDCSSCNYCSRSSRTTLVYEARNSHPVLRHASIYNKLEKIRITTPKRIKARCQAKCQIRNDSSSTTWCVCVSVFELQQVDPTRPTMLRNAVKKFAPRDCYFFPSVKFLPVSAFVHRASVLHGRAIRENLDATPSTVYGGSRVLR